MKIALVTDAWQPQVNGVVTTLVELVRELGAAGHEVHVIHPGQFRTRPCPGYAGIDLAVRPGRQMARQLDALQPQAVHIATEGPLGWAARAHCRRRGWRFTTAFHTKFPEILHAALKVPLSWGYALFRHLTATTASWPSTSACSTGPGAPMCPCWSACATCASSRPTWMSFLRCAPPRMSRHADWRPPGR
jgi:hypothetical protein